jgi:hypothetical protein
MLDNAVCREVLVPVLRPFGVHDVRVIGKACQASHFALQPFQDELLHQFCLVFNVVIGSLMCQNKFWAVEWQSQRSLGQVACP